MLILLMDYGKLNFITSFSFHHIILSNNHDTVVFLFNIHQVFMVCQCPLPLRTISFTLRNNSRNLCKTSEVGKNFLTPQVEQLGQAKVGKRWGEA